MAVQHNGLSRRSMLKGAAGLVIGLHLPLDAAKAQSGAAQVFTPDAGAAAFAPNAFVRIAADDTVTVLIKHIEFGQGPFTGLATLVAEELDADWAKVRAEHAPSNPELYKNLAFGVQGTGGSRPSPTPTSRCARPARRRAPCWSRRRRRPGACRPARSRWSAVCCATPEADAEAGSASSRRPRRSCRCRRTYRSRTRRTFRLIGREGAVRKLDSAVQGQRHRAVHHRYPRAQHAHGRRGAACPVRRKSRVVRGRRRAGGARRGRRQRDPLGCRRLCRRHVARTQGTRKAARDLGRSQRREAQQRPARRRVSGSVAQARHGCGPAWRCGSGAGPRSEGDRGGIRLSLSGACADGAAGRLPALGWRAGGGAPGQPAADGRPPDHCRRARPQARSGAARDHAGRRQLRPACANHHAPRSRAGACRQGDRPGPPGEAGLDPRG